jgi:antitoxin (DNA-binding transcriptional repressor) of toxin-antitoxin stability system
MQVVGTYEAKTNLAALLDRVVKGESFIITRYGNPMAILTKPDYVPLPDAKKAIEGIKNFRKKFAGAKFAGTGEDTDVVEMIEESRRERRKTMSNIP